MNPAVVISCVASLALNVLILNALVRSRYERHRVLFCYAIILFVTNCIDIALYLEDPSWSSFAARRVAWTNQVIRQTGLYLVVISFVYSALSVGYRSTVRRLVVMGAILYGLGSIVLLQGPKMSLWMTQVLRNLSFGCAILTLALWALLLNARERDRQSLLLVGGLGLQITGEAVGQSLRNLWQVSPWTVFLGDTIMILAHLLCLFVWWTALKYGNSSQQNPTVPPRRSGGRIRPITPLPKSLTSH